MAEYDERLTDLDRSVLTVLAGDFPVSWGPYCDIGELVGAPEIEVLNSVAKLRETGAVRRLGTQPAEPALGSDAADEDATLAQMLYDLPFSEHPYDEVAEMMQLRGFEVDSTWVLTRTRELIASGLIERLSADS